MNIVKIGNRGWLLEVDLDGGRIYKLTCGDQLILGTFDRIDGKKGIHMYVFQILLMKE